MTKPDVVYRHSSESSGFAGGQTEHAQQRSLKALPLFFFFFFPLANLPLSKPNLKNILENTLYHKKLKRCYTELKHKVNINALLSGLY